MRTNNYLYHKMTETPVLVHPTTNDPTKTWKEMRQKVIQLKLTPPNFPVPKRMLRFVCMSDTHSLTSQIKFTIPDGDVFVHTGDFTRCGGKEEIVQFNTWVGTLPHKYKLVIAGNHELSFDSRFNPNSKRRTDEIVQGDRISPASVVPVNCEPSEIKEAIDQGDPRDLLTKVTYLEDTHVQIAGISIYGSPWQPEYLKWAFNLPRGQPMLEMWKEIPSGIDVLLTHTPPLGYGDLCVSGQRAGCVELLNSVQNRIKPKYHVFGHIHEGYGVTTDGITVFINASTCDANYKPCNPPIVFDIPIPKLAEK